MHQHSQDYWSTRMCDRVISRMAMLPMLGVSAALLYEASTLWHSWGKKRAKELRSMAADINERAAGIRKNGLGWSSRAVTMDVSSLLCGYSYYRHFSPVEDAPRHPLAVPELIARVLGCLFWCRDIALRLEKLSYEERGTTSWIETQIEMLMESPVSAGISPLTMGILDSLGECGVHLECEGLCRTLARIEESYTEYTGERKKKKARMSDLDTTKLAAEIGVAPELLKEVLETEYSSWWDRSASYGKSAVADAETFLYLPSQSNEVNGYIFALWDAGSLNDRTDSSWSKCRDKASLDACEQIINVFLALFLSSRGHFESKDVQQELEQFRGGPLLL